MKYVQEHSKACLTGCRFLLLHSWNNGSSITDLKNQSVPGGRPKREKRRKSKEKREIENTERNIILHSGQAIEVFRVSQTQFVLAQVHLAPYDGNQDEYLFLFVHVCEGSEPCGYDLHVYVCHCSVMSAFLHSHVCQEVNSKCFVPVCLTLEYTESLQRRHLYLGQAASVFSPSFSLSPYPAYHVSPGNAPPPFLPPLLPTSLLLLSGALSSSLTLSSFNLSARMKEWGNKCDADFRTCITVPLFVRVNVYDSRKCVFVYVISILLILACYLCEGFHWVRAGGTTILLITPSCWVTQRAADIQTPSVNATQREHHHIDSDTPLVFSDTCVILLLSAHGFMMEDWKRSIEDNSSCLC